MPLYDFECTGCGAVATHFRKIESRDAACSCPGCFKPMARMIAAPFIRPDYPGYESPATGKWVEGRQAHKEDLARSGCRILEPGETEGLRRKREAADEAFCESIADSAAREVANWPQAKQEKLATELEHGASVGYQRLAPTT